MLSTGPRALTSTPGIIQPQLKVDSTTLTSSHILTTMPPRKKTAPSAKALSAKVKKAAEAAEMRAASSIAKRVTRTAPSPQAVPIPPTVSAPKITKNQINVEVTLTPVEGRKIRLDFNIGKGDESANLSRKRTLQDAFLATCRLQGLDDVEVVQCTGVDGAACSEHTLSRIMGYSDDTFCTVTFR